MKHKHEQGQALILIVIFTVIGSLVISAAVMLTLINSTASDKVYQGSNAYDIAESGAETAMIKLLRDPMYAGETVPVSDGQAVVSVSGTNPITITSTGIRGNFRRKIQVTVTTTNNILTVTSWKEVY